MHRTKCKKSFEGVDFFLVLRLAAFLLLYRLELEYSIRHFIMQSSLHVALCMLDYVSHLSVYIQYEAVITSHYLRAHDGFYSVTAPFFTTDVIS